MLYHKIDFCYFIFDMVKYLFDGGLSVCLLALLFVLSTCASRQPTPNCTAPKVILRDLPISPQEMQSFNLNNFFTGYNLNISANTKPEFATLNPRI